MAKLRLKVQKPEKKTWKVLSESNPLEEFKIRVRHIDGTLGNLLSISEHETHLIVKFDDGAITNQPISSVRFLDNSETISFRKPSTKVNLYTYTEIAQTSDFLRESSIEPPRVEEAINLILSFRVHEQTTPHKTSQSRRFSYLLSTLYALDHIETLDFRTFKDDISQVKEPHLQRAIGLIFRAQVIGYTLNRLFLESEADIPITTLWEEVSGLPFGFADDFFLQTALKCRITDLIASSRTISALKMASEAKHLLGRSLLVTAIFSARPEILASSFESIKSNLRNGKLKEARALWSSIKNADFDGKDELASRLSECEEIYSVVRPNATCDLVELKNSLTFYESKKFLDERIDSLQNDLSSRYKQAIQRSLAEAYSVLEEYSFLPKYFTFKRALLQTQKSRLHKLRVRLYSAGRKYFKENISRLQNKIVAYRFSSEYKQEALDEQSIRLLGHWSDGQIPSENFEDFLESAWGQSAHLLTRLYSARQAELIAAEFLEAIGKSSQDVSVQQIDSNDASKDWVTHDIDTGDIRYDVKNARAALSSKKNYSEFCVPQFKRDRELQSVRILAVFSLYRTVHQIRNHDHGTAVVLGDVSRPEIEDFEECISRVSEGLLMFSSWNREGSVSSFLSGWLFEYPREFYSEHNELTRATKCILKKFQKHFPEGRKVSRAFEFMICKGAPNANDDDLREFAFISPLMKMIRAHGLNRRSLFSGVLLVCLLEAKKQESSFTPKALREFLFTGQDFTRPAGLYDPLEYISELISVFDHIFVRCRDRILDFQSFKLTHNGILQGQTAEGQWQTIIAYCGGWKRFPKSAKCGKNPIHIGTSNNCPECGKVICRDCGFCSQRCVECDARQQKVAEATDGHSDGFRGDFFRIL